MQVAKTTHVSATETKTEDRPDSTVGLGRLPGGESPGAWHGGSCSILVAGGVEGRVCQEWEQHGQKLSGRKAQSVFGEGQHGVSIGKTLASTCGAGLL